MGKQIYKKLHRNRGIARLVVILSVLALVLVAAALYPVIQHYRFRADALGCLITASARMRWAVLRGLTRREGSLPHNISSTARTAARKKRGTMWVS